MAKLRFEIAIKRSPETVFQLLSDLPGYTSWLPPSRLYKQTTISDHPIKVGTTYHDKGPSAEMHGEVTALEPFSHLAFHQSMHLKQAWLSGELDIHIRYTLHPTKEGTQVIREGKVRTQGIFKVVQPVLLGAIRKENERTLQRVKWYLEAR